MHEHSLNAPVDEQMHAMNTALEALRNRPPSFFSPAAVDFFPLKIDNKCTLALACGLSGTQTNKQTPEHTMSMLCICLPALARPTTLNLDIKDALNFRNRAGAFDSKTGEASREYDGGRVQVGHTTPCMPDIWNCFLYCQAVHGHAGKLRHTHINNLIY